MTKLSKSLSNSKKKSMAS